MEKATIRDVTEEKNGRMYRISIAKTIPEDLGERPAFKSGMR